MGKRCALGTFFGVILIEALGNSKLNVRFRVQLCKPKGKMPSYSLSAPFV